jgi:hypothetical protein
MSRSALIYEEPFTDSCLKHVLAPWDAAVWYSRALRGHAMCCFDANTER